MSVFPQDGLDRLAARVAAGEAVFFIGSGFSADSEGNTTKRLISRLLSRFDAATRLLANGKFIPGKDVGIQAQALRDGLKETFSISENEGKPLTSSDHIDTLAREYYTFNDWITSAFSLLLGEIERIPHQHRFLDRLHEKEQSLLVELAKDLKGKPTRLPILTKEDLEKILALSTDRGKALFLETMGFADLEVMAGDSCAMDLTTAQKSYGHRLLPRHHVLAWFAREGLSPTLLTTNFDLLLEGAYRLAGLTPQFPQRVRLPKGSTPPKAMKGSPPASFDAFCRIASATQFFGRGDDRRSAHLLKIHGCAESYRWARGQGKDALSAYLPSMVFTFREIQNWREDSWSRDLVSTLLRTRTIVFCGYSTADPVLHDTIRTVYEEMARRRGQRERRVPVKRDGEEAPAFFLGGEGKTEFHGMEILRAASRAVGNDPGLTDHSNYLRFHFIQKEESAPQPFPTLDEIMRWLFHLTFRRRQRQAIDSDLGRIVTLLLGYPCPEAEQRVVKNELGKLLRAEKSAAKRWNEGPFHRFQFERIVGWTERFQVGLMREFALADAALRFAGPGVELIRLRRSRWYYPALDHTDWAAWGAVVELALRRRISALQKQERGWACDRPWLAPGAGDHPSVLYARDKLQPTPFCLAIRLRPQGRRGRSPAVRGACRHQHIWELGYGDIPWRRRLGLVSDGGTPDAATIWEWAHAPFTRIKGGSFATLV